MGLRSILVSLDRKLTSLHHTGVEKEQDGAKHRYIIVLNRISFATFLILLLTAIFALLFTEDHTLAIGGLIISVTYLIPIYLNKVGKTFSGKMFMVIYTNISVIAFASLFAHTGTIFANYYFAIIAGTNFLFSYNERKWLLLSTAISLFLYVLESSSFFTLIPYIYPLKDIAKVHTLLLFSHVLMMFFILWIFLQTIKKWEDDLLRIQQQILASEHKLKVQNADLETFSMAASHSLQTPIYVSKFFLNNIKEEGYGMIDKKKIDIIDDSLDQMGQLVSGLFSYNEIINIEEDHAAFDVYTEFEKIKKRMNEKFIGCVVDICGKGLLLKTNKMLFSIIIQNLVDNGLKYNRSQPPTITIDYEINGPIFSVIVVDNGIGIDKIYFDKIFEPFKRLDTLNHFKGTGLGLSGAKRAAEKIGGKLTCKESSPKGSKFQLDLPYYN